MVQHRQVSTRLELEESCMVLRWPAVAVLMLSAPLMAADWKLVWSDEFNGKGSPDAAKWTYEEGFIRNHEAQRYTSDPANARMENGYLVIEARKDGDKITSASVTTEGKTAWTHARIEVRAKLPAGRGTWPAIWLLGVNHRQAGWPKCGEIDVMEHVGFDPGIIHANIHTAKYNHVKKTNKGDKITVDDPSGSFHIYAVEWSGDRMDFSVDHKTYFFYENEKSGTDAWPFDEPMYLILNVAIGGSWGGQKGVDDSIFPQKMEVDWVHVYKRAGE